MKIFEKRNILIKISYQVLPVLFVFYNISCSSSTSNENDLITIDLKKVIQNETEVPLSLFVDTLEYIQLEMTSESAITHIEKLYLTDKQIIIRSDNLLMLFDRKSGKFIHLLGNLGKGPEEYSNPLNCFYNSLDKRIYTYGYMKSSVKIFNLDGKFVESFETPGATEVSSYKKLPIDAFLNSSTYAGYINNWTGQIKIKLVIFNKDKIFATYPNYEIWASDQVTIDQDPVFFSWGTRVSFKETSNDTIFYISNDKLIPRIVLFSGDLRSPYKLSREEAIEQLTKPKNYFNTRNIFENSNYLFFDLDSKLKQIENSSTAFQILHNLCILDKRTKSIITCNNNANNISGMTDDINNFMPIEPISITENNELVAVLYATEIKKWKTNNPKLSEVLISKLPWLDKIGELDNPVIVIARCKE